MFQILIITLHFHLNLFIKLTDKRYGKHMDSPTFLYKVALQFFQFYYFYLLNTFI